MQVKFGNKECEAIQVVAAMDVVDNTTRACVEIHLPVESNSVDELHELLADPANTNTITTSDPSGSLDGGVVSQVFDNFTMLVKCGVERVLTQKYDEQGQPVAENRIVVRLARKTVQEMQMEQMMAAMKKAGLM